MEIMYDEYSPAQGTMSENTFLSKTFCRFAQIYPIIKGIKDISATTNNVSLKYIFHLSFENSAPFMANNINTGLILEIIVKNLKNFNPFSFSTFLSYATNARFIFSKILSNSAPKTWRALKIPPLSSMAS